MPLPTFLIVGVQKSGTSTLFKTLEQHPQIELTRPKELHFFDLRRSRGVDWYADQWHPGPETTQWGESTPAYMYFDKARAGIAEVVPDAKLVAILRDPVKRAYSHFWHAKRTRREDSETFEEGLALEAERLTQSIPDQARFSYTDRGYYIDQLEDLAARQGRDNLHVMLLDDLTANRVPTLERLFEFLEVDPGAAHQLDEVWTYRYQSLPDLGSADQEEREAREKQEAREKREALGAYPEMAPETERRLAELFEPHTRRLEKWLDRDLSAWTRA